MRGRIEYADGARTPSRTSTFPGSWGVPPLDECQRAGWIAAHVVSTRGTHVRALAPHQDPATAPLGASGRVPPGIRHRQAIVELLARRWTGA
jgi:hypothetical protein